MEVFFGTLSRNHDILNECVVRVSAGVVAKREKPNL